MRNPDRPLSVAALLLAIGVTITTPSAANPFPSRPMTVVASAATGGLIAIVAPAYAAALATKFGQA